MVLTGELETQGATFVLRISSLEQWKVEIERKEERASMEVWELFRVLKMKEKESPKT